MAITINGSGTITGISAGGLPDGSVTAADLADTYLSSVTSGDLPSGSVLQIKQAVKSDLFSGSSNIWHKITGLSETITPSSTSSKILIQVHIVTNDQNNFPCFYHIHADGTRVTPAGNALYSGNVTGGYGCFAGGSVSGAMGNSTIAFSYLHSPNTTSSVEYAVYGGKPSVAVSQLVVNQFTAGTVGSSSITLMEIAG